MSSHSYPASLVPLPIDVVSIQSQVVYGRVGNNAALPVLDAFGLMTAAVPTVVLSNTPHYPTLHGGALPPAWFDGYLQGLSDRGVMQSLKAVLCGYLGGPQQARALTGWIASIVQERNDLLIVIDPVLGDYDHGEYVDPGMADAYQHGLLTLADGLTPNSFELQRLTGLPVDDIDSAVVAARILLTGRTQWAVVTSALPKATPADQLSTLVVTRQRHEVFRQPRMDAFPKGTGDLFSAALLGHLLAGASVFEAAPLACELVASAVRRTQQARCAELLMPEFPCPSKKGCQ
ncbi:MAG: pyridoxine/pyridoxal/pyridoxamine kinase [Burkholderiaceae bacterium]|jgi:pyridoxine kinase|nr:pyridoxine/pyridoxal/pyridoxamine kinase [Burkholderiaceae bacterium]